MTQDNLEYIGKDLEAMHFAQAYRTWVLELIRPYLGKNIVEVGAGTGSFSRLLLETQPTHLTLVEPSAMFEALSAELSQHRGPTQVKLFHDLFSNVADEIRGQGPPDSIVYINVLEHIDDDIKELELAHQTLSPDGRIVLFVPALPLLYSKFDRHIGHHRRYRRSDLKTKCEAAGFKVLMIRWFDSAGVLPWLVKFRLLRSMKVEPAAVRLYDRFAVPITRKVENLISPPFGKNLLLIGETGDRYQEAKIRLTSRRSSGVR